tara:strand:+ start:1173 stop:2324 length:1152 start_codon:yes stop_codon:yes gene_type:complete
MGIEYVNVDTQWLQNTNNRSEYEIHLEKPIKDAYSMKLSSFSTANDMFNVDASNDTFQIIMKSKEDPSVNDSSLRYFLTVEIEHGFYTQAQLLAAIRYSIRKNDAVTPIVTDANGIEDEDDGLAIPFIVRDSTNGQVHLTHNPSFDIKVTATGHTHIELKTSNVATANTGLKWGFLGFRRGVESFQHSILHRLGFGVHQVYVYENLANDFKNADSIIFHPLLGGHARTVALGAEAYVKAFTFDMKSTGDLKTKVAHHLPVETYEAILIECDLVNDFQITTPNYSSIRKTEHRPILARIPITTNRASWVHWTSVTNEDYSHELSTPEINSFKIRILKDSHDQFYENTHKPFNLTLQFNTRTNKALNNIQSYDAVRMEMQEWAYR